jgi:hypothetical protein
VWLLVYYGAAPSRAAARAAVGATPAQMYALGTIGPASAPPDQDRDVAIFAVDGQHLSTY